MDQPIIYTIGYGNRDLSVFFALLKHYNINCLLDVRSFPVSKYNQDFNRENLEPSVVHNGMRYVFMGHKLGGRPDDPSCYIEGRVQYAQLGTKDYYLDGVNRIIRAWRQSYRMILMCSELRPQDCHRCKLIGETLTAQQIPIVHIDENGNERSHETAIKLALDQQSIFGDELTSRKQYKVKEKGHRD